MSDLNQPQGNPVQQQGVLQDELQGELQQQQQTSPEVPPQADDQELDTAADQEPLPGDGETGVDGDDQTDQLRQKQANQQSDADREEDDIYRGEPKSDIGQADIASK